MNSDAMQNFDCRGPQFKAVLRPYRSLSQVGFQVLMTLIVTVSFVAGVVFVSLGAWPVVGFLGLDVVLIWLAFRRSYLDANACEIVEISDHKLTVTYIDRWGQTTVAEFNPAWVRLDVTESSDGSVALALVSHGKSFEFARDLNVFERGAFAEVLGRELAKARSGKRM